MDHFVEACRYLVHEIKERCPKCKDRLRHEDCPSWRLRRVYEHMQRYFAQVNNP